MKLKPHDPDYPRLLCHLDEPPIITVSGPLKARRLVAIVGSRDPVEGACRIAHGLAYHLARAGVTVVSGGAIGVDRIAHEAALRGGGSTWLVSPAGRGILYPRQNEKLIKRLAASATSRVIWPFPDGTPMTSETPRFRNGVLVGLAECVVVIQAANRSGSRNSARWARRLDRSLYVVPGMPDDEKFGGSMTEGADGAQPFWSINWFFNQRKLPPPDLDDPNAKWRGMRPLRTPLRRKPVARQSYANPPLFRVEPATWSEDEKSVFSILSVAPTQQDTIIVKSGLPTSSTLTALLTLSLKDVVVEGPDGFFRRRVSP